jgi:hypothetical protein
VQPWAGLIAGVGGWIAHHQFISDALHFDCRVGNAASTAIVGVLVIIGIVLGAAWSWPVLREDKTSAIEEGGTPPQEPTSSEEKVLPEVERSRETHACEEQRRTASSRAFAARLSLMAAALFALLVAVQTMAGLMLPGCPP